MSEEMADREIFILARGPLQFERVGDEGEFCKYHITGKDLAFGDKYHTMHELYQHRLALTAALFNYAITGDDLEVKAVMKSKLHNDGTMFDGYFIVMMITEEGQISYHYDLKYWDKFQIPEVERIPVPYDGHTGADVIERLLKVFLP